MSESISAVDVESHKQLQKMFSNDEIEIRREVETEDDSCREKKKNHNKTINKTIIALMCVAALFFFIKLYVEEIRGNENNNQGEKSVFSTNIAVGDNVEFGNYEIDDNISNGKERLTWRVLNITDGKALLLTDECIDIMQYNKDGSDNKWSNSQVREWLNNDFLNETFEDTEKAHIIETDLESGYCPLPSSDDHPENTTDKVFILDFDNYYNNDNVNDARLTPYAKNKYQKCIKEYNGELTIEKTVSEDYTWFEENIYEDYGWCWLRNIGPVEKTVQYMWQFKDAKMSSYGNGFCMSNYYNAVRPAIWIKLDA